MIDAIRRTNWNRWLFAALYICVAGATFRHSAVGFASLENGSLALGALSALAVDAGMMLSASGLRTRRNAALILGLAVSAAFSTYTQLLYSVAHATQVSVAPGAAWLPSAQMIIELRVVALPAVLPLLSVIYAFAAKDNSIDDKVDQVRRELYEMQQERDAMQRERDDALSHVEAAQAAVASVEAFDLLNVTDQARLIAASTNGEGPSVKDVAAALRCSPSVVSRVKKEREE